MESSSNNRGSIVETRVVQLGEHHVQEYEYGDAMDAFTDTFFLLYFLPWRKPVTKQCNYFTLLGGDRLGTA